MVIICWFLSKQVPFVFNLGHKTPLKTGFTHVLENVSKNWM